MVKARDGPFYEAKNAYVCIPPKFLCVPGFMYAPVYRPAEPRATV